MVPKSAVMKLTGLNEDERHCAEVAGYYYSGYGDFGSGAWPYYIKRKAIYKSAPGTYSTDSHTFIGALWTDLVELECGIPPGVGKFKWS